VTPFDEILQAICTYAMLEETRIHKTIEAERNENQQTPVLDQCTIMVHCHTHLVIPSALPNGEKPGVTYPIYITTHYFNSPRFY
jgi:hypothetical protein